MQLSVTKSKGKENAIQDCLIREREPRQHQFQRRQLDRTNREREPRHPGLHWLRSGCAWCWLAGIEVITGAPFITKVGYSGVASLRGNAPITRQ